MRLPLSSRHAHRPWWAVFVSLLSQLGLSVGLSACIAELPRRVACGDGFVDVEAGEECDPADGTNAHFGQCAAQGFSQGNAGCDPETCQVIVDNFQCAVCGDGKVEGNEACDGPIPPANTACPDAARTTPLCDGGICQADFSTCPTCQNGVKEPNEECDPVAPCDGIAAGGLNCEPGGEPPIVMPTNCEELEVLASTVNKTSYTAGAVNQSDCTTGCRYDRRNCSFCGDGVLDPQHLDVGLGGQVFTRLAEKCEVGLANPPPLVQESCNDWCRASAPDIPTSCNFRCITGCLDIELDFDGLMETADPIADLGCCSPRDTPCGVAPEFPCCNAPEDPDEGDGCVPKSFGSGIQLVCR